MAETKLAFALAGLGGFNAHGAGFLQAARDNNIEPDLVTATSGQIVVLAAYLKGAKDLKKGLIDKALQIRFGDQSLRYAYPLASWVVEPSSDPAQGMVTLNTVDGFSVCFSIPRQQQSELGEALVAEPATQAKFLIN